MAYAPGELDQIINIKRETLTDDGYGGQEVELVDVEVDLWARVRPLSGKEIQRYDQLKASAMVVFVIRNRNDLRHDDRIVWNGVEHNIRYIEPVSQREMYLAVEAERGVVQ